MIGHVQMILFYAALLPGFVNFAEMSPADFVLVGLLLVVTLGGVNAAYALLAARRAAFLPTNGRSVRCTVSRAP
jgi:threonine/homoserine/homoserine lactone efflux protein